MNLFLLTIYNIIKLKLLSSFNESQQIMKSEVINNSNDKIPKALDIKDGGTVPIKKDVEVGQNDIGVFLYGDEALVKRYKCIEDRCYLTSDNKDYPDREIREDDDFKVCGKVVWILNKT